MTTLASWIACDQNKHSAIYIATDSRISQGAKKYSDSSQKIFSIKSTSDILGYSGDTLFVTQIILKFISFIEQGFLKSGSTADEKFKNFHYFLKNESKTYLSDIVNSEILYFTNINKNFYAARFSYNKQIEYQLIDLNVTKSSILQIHGSGGRSYKETLSKYQKSDIADKSRMFYTAFCDNLIKGDDPFSGGAPQLVGIYRNGESKIFGNIYCKNKYYLGTKIDDLPIIGENIEWRNENFERCSFDTGKIIKGAQRQPDPTNSAR